MVPAEHFAAIYPVRVAEDFRLDRLPAHSPILRARLHRHHQLPQRIAVPPVSAGQDRNCGAPDLPQQRRSDPRSKAILSNAPAVFVEVRPLTLPRYRNKFEDLWTLIEYSRYDIFIQRNDSEEPVIYSPEATLVGRAHLFFKPQGHLAQH
jgi:hypothetical protein